MSVSIFRSDSSVVGTEKKVTLNLNSAWNLARKFGIRKNPWDLADLSLYQFFVCPESECEFQSQKDFLFRNHMSESHPSIDSSEIIKCKIEPDVLIRNFLENNSDFDDDLDDGIVGDIRMTGISLDIIRNPPMPLPTVPPPLSENRRNYFDFEFQKPAAPVPGKEFREKTTIQIYGRKSNSSSVYDRNQTLTTSTTTSFDNDNPFNDLYGNLYNNLQIICFKIRHLPASS
jgi:hypothetical protein